MVEIKSKVWKQLLEKHAGKVFMTADGSAIAIVEDQPIVRTIHAPDGSNFAKMNDEEVLNFVTRSLKL